MEGATLFIGLKAVKRVAIYKMETALFGIAIKPNPAEPCE